MKKLKSNTTKRIAIALLTVVVTLIVSVLVQSRIAYAGWTFGDYDQDWEDVNYAFKNYKYVGTDGKYMVYQSDRGSKKNTWSRAWEMHTFGDYSVAVCGDNIDFYYTRESGANWDRDLVMKMNFSLYRITHPSEKYTFQVKVYDGSDNDGRIDHTGYLTEVRNPVGGDIVPGQARSSTLAGIEFLYPYFFLDYNSLAEALCSGTWVLTFDRMHVYDDR